MFKSTRIWYKQLISFTLFSSLSCDILARGHKRYLKFDLITLGVEGFLPIISQFLYLLILSNKTKPFFARKYPSKKKFRFGYTVGDTAKYACYVNSNQSQILTTKLYTYLMERQLSPEKSTVWINDKYTKIIVWNAPLTLETNPIEVNQNIFLPDMPMYYKFSSGKSLSREILFWVKFYHFLRSNNKNLWFLQLSPYYYYE